MEFIEVFHVKRWINLGPAITTLKKTSEKHQGTSHRISFSSQIVNDRKYDCK